MSETGKIVYFNKFHEGDGAALAFPTGVQGVGMMLCGVAQGQQPPDELAIDYLFATVAIYRFELIMEALGLDEAGCKNLVLKIQENLDKRLALQQNQVQLVEKPKLVLVTS